MTSTRQQLVDLIDQQALSSQDIPRAVAASGLYPDGVSWHRFLDHLLLWMAGLALASSVVFLVAYNWSAWGRFARFGLVEAAVVLSALAYVRFGRHPVAAQAALLAATVSLGALLALVGQVYQTGADPWQLFFAWAVLMLPWALLGRAAILWVIWVGLLNLSSLLYFRTFGVFGLLFTGSEAVYWWLLLFNSLALAGWEAVALRWRWLAVDWARRLLATASGTAATWLVLVALFNDRVGDGPALFAWVVWLAALYAVYRRWRLDLFMLAGGCLSGTVVVTALLISTLFEGNEVGGFAFTALVILGMGAASAQWLKAVHREANP